MQEQSTSASWGAYLRAFEWSHFATLTSSLPRSESWLLAEFSRYVRCLERIAQCRVEWFVAAEETFPGCAHLHALLNGTQRLSIERLDAKWKPGFARIRCYDPRRRAAFYVAKRLEPDSYSFRRSRDHGRVA